MYQPDEGGEACGWSLTTNAVAKHVITLLSISTKQTNGALTKTIGKFFN